MVKEKKTMNSSLNMATTQKGNLSLDTLKTLLITASNADASSVKNS
jgi:hypothetical protein